MFFVYLILIIVGVTFAALNASSVPINLYVKTFTMPIAVLMAIMLALGLIIGFFLALGKYWRLKVELSKMRSQLRLTEKEIKNLRDIPLKDQH
ncbi:LapA family protein [Legionella birminghamensis]|nr:LapA family protein [Legionella birminghamensis]